MALKEFSQVIFMFFKRLVMFHVKQKTDVYLLLFMFHVKRIEAELYTIYTAKLSCYGIFAPVNPTKGGQCGIFRWSKKR